MSEQPHLAEPDLGNIWFIGAGSVGSSAIYFLPFATCKFLPTVVDMDCVEGHNLDRSPIFTAEDAKNKRNKADVAAQYLKMVGIQSVTPKTIALHETNWLERKAGAPDLLISAANEQNVRYYIENGFPPLQIYSTTGKNWQSTLFTHVPMQGECSCCVFPPDSPSRAMKCAEGMVQNIDAGKQVDASLPFLSFAAGLMTVAEILKLDIPEYRLLSRRVMLEMTDSVRIVSSVRNPRDGCLCTGRSRDIHNKMLSGSRYEYLSNSNISKLSVLE
jgi:molybdopterin/thiamine biosynthesis adenylyltransferase